MLLLAFGVFFTAALHLVAAVPSLKARLKERVGERAYGPLFGTFLVVGLADILMSEIRGKRPDYIPRLRSDVLAVVIGIVLYAVFLFGFHPYVLGIPVV